MPFNTWNTLLYRQPPFQTSLFHGGLDCESLPHPPIPEHVDMQNFLFKND